MLKEFKIENFVVILLITIAVLQGLSLLLTQIFGFKTLKFGPIFYLFAIAIGVGLGISAVVRGIRGTKVDKLDVLVFVLVAGVIVFLSIYAKQLVPSIFSTANLELQSMIGIGP